MLTGALLPLHPSPRGASLVALTRRRWQRRRYWAGGRGKRAEWSGRVTIAVCAAGFSHGSIYGARHWQVSRLRLQQAGQDTGTARGQPAAQQAPLHQADGASGCSRCCWEAIQSGLRTFFSLRYFSLRLLSFCWFSFCWSSFVLPLRAAFFFLLCSFCVAASPPAAFPSAFFHLGARRPYAPFLPAPVAHHA